MSSLEYTIRIVGCDDTTKFNVRLSSEGLTSVLKIARISHEVSDCSCMPVLKVDGFKMKRKDDDD